MNSFLVRCFSLSLFIPFGIHVSRSIASIAIVNTETMRPCLLPNDVLVVSKLNTERRKFKRNDIVLFYHPSVYRKRMISQIVALPGDSVSFDGEEGSFTLATGHCLMLGKNDDNPEDTSDFFQISMGLIVGQVKFIIWPLHRIGFVQSQPDYASTDLKELLE